MTTTAAVPQAGTGHRCLICRNRPVERVSDACRACKARMFDEYLAVKGGL